MQGFQFPKGNYYQIICRAGNQALKLQESDPDSYDKSRVIGVYPSLKDDSQIWMIEKVGQKEDSIQIVNCLSTFVLDQQGKEIKVRPGKQGKDQLFAIAQAPTNYTQPLTKYFYIRTDTSGKQAVSLQQTLRLSDFNPNSENQMFRFQPIQNQNNTIRNSALIVSNISGNAIDVPRASRKQGEGIIIWEKNRRWNQRWAFVKQGKGVYIQSVCNGLVLDVEGQKRSSGTRAIQWDKTSGLNQIWIPESVGNGFYKFRCCHQPTLYLAIKGQGTNKGSHLQVSDKENPSMYWRVEGCYP